MNKFKMISKCLTCGKSLITEKKDIEQKENYCIFFVMWLVLGLIGLVLIVWRC